jgi:hypothetical protein
MVAALADYRKQEGARNAAPKRSGATAADIPEERPMRTVTLSFVNELGNSIDVAAETDDKVVKKPQDYRPDIGEHERADVRRSSDDLRCAARNRLWARKVK